MSGYTVLACPSCGAKASLTPGDTTATCQFCGSQLILTPDQAAVLRGGPRRQEETILPVPPGLSAQQTSQGLALTRRWFSPQYIFMAVFTVFWDAFLLFWFGMVFSSDAPLFLALFPIIHVAVGAYLTYSTLAGFLNTSVITVNRERLTVTHGPLPWPGAARLDCGEIDQLYVREIVRHTRRSTRVSYTLAAVLTSGRAVDVLRGLDRPDTALALEGQIERYLNIPDRPVAGELRKSA